jgi:hypothetical protein
MNIAFADTAVTAVTGAEVGKLDQSAQMHRIADILIAHQTGIFPDGVKLLI